MRAPASPVRTVFLDDGGVLNDNERRAPEWRRLLGEFFAPRFGGTEEAWGAANMIVIREIWSDWELARAGGTELGPDWFPRQDERWLTGMFDRVGLPVPADIDGTVRASRAHVMAHIDCAFPEAAAAVRAVHARGLTLHMASGGLSSELAPYLERMGIRELFDRLYGPDLIGASKTSPRYYERIAADSGIDPETAIVVDSHAEPLEWAAASGFRTVHLDRGGAGSPFTRIASLDQLLPLLDR
ncbi:MAG TPA: HAD family hydrolase [Candidatus Limnocylindria bacterium]